MAQGWLQIAIFLAVVVALTPPLGAYMARVYRNERVFLTPVLGGVERLTYRADLSPTDPRLCLELGQVYLTSHDAARAVVELRRALELRPGWAAARQRLAQARAANGELPALRIAPARSA